MKISEEQKQFAYEQIRHGFSCAYIAKQLGVEENDVLDAIYGPAYAADSLEALED